MVFSVTRRSALALLPVLLLAGVAGCSGASQPQGETHDTYVHHVVWDEDVAGRHGIHLRSAGLDGTDPVRVYDSAGGFVTHLTMDRAGQRVAFAPCCTDGLPTLVVVPVAGGKAIEPLRRHPKIFFVGGIGWSPDGSRIAFEGSVDGARPGTTHKFLWTVRADGTGLEQVRALSDQRQTSINDDLAWTDSGILYSDRTGLRLATDSTSTLVIPGVSSVRITGDGRHIVTVRGAGAGYEVWYGDPDGGNQEKLLSGVPGQDDSYLGVTPNHDGSAFLAQEMRVDVDEDADRVVTWASRTGPDSAEPLKFVAGLIATWS